MIRIEQPIVEYTDDSAILSSYITIADKREQVWFKVDKEYGEYLCYERGDSFLIAVLNYAIRNNHDVISEAPISEDLYYNIDTYLIDGLVKYNPSFHRIHISAPVASEQLPNAGAVGTGISCGVDSLHVLACQTSDKFPKHKVTHLTFNNVGSQGEGEHARELYSKRLENPRKFAKEYRFKFVASDSNLMDVVKQSHYKTHTYSSMFAVFCLQKLYSVYYYASAGFLYQDFTLVDEPSICCGSYEVLSLPLFSTHQLRIYSEGENLSRMDKLSTIVGFRPSYKFLNVCLHDGKNCSKCEKCVRTMLGLDALGKLNLYKEVFDVDYYYSHKKWYLKQMIRRMAEYKHDYFELYEYHKKDMTPSLYLFKAFFTPIWRLRNKLVKYIRKTPLYPIIKK